MDIVLKKEYLKFINYWLKSLLFFIVIIVIVGGLTRLTDIPVCLLQHGMLYQVFCLH